MSDDQKSLELFGRGEAVEDIASPLLAYQMADIFNDRRLSDIFKDCDGLVQVLEAGEPGSISFVIRYIDICISTYILMHP